MLRLKELQAMAKNPRWTPEEIEYLRTHYGLKPKKEISVDLGRSLHAIQNIFYRRLGGATRLELCSPNLQGAKLVWTKEKVIEGLQAAAKELGRQLPTSDEVYNPLKKGRYDWPPALYIYKYFPTFAVAWLAAGIKPSRVNLSSTKWTEEEDEYLLTHAGDIRLVTIAKYLRRSYGGVRGRLRFKNHLKARHNQGYLSAAELAKHYNCPYHRVRDALIAGKIKGFRSRIRNDWQVDLVDIDEQALEILEQPKLKTHRTTPPDIGDYMKRHGLKRTKVNGKRVIVLA